MAFLKRFKAAPPPTATDVVLEDKPLPAAQDLEKHRDELSVSESLPQTHNENIDPELERRVVRKMDFRIVPLVSALYILSFLDRSNIGNARIAGMREELHLVGNRYQWLLTIFYITYILFEWQTLMWKVVPPHIWASFVVFGWGLIATAQSGVHSWSGLMACRFFLGISEAGFV
ncbi:uncharacterized protein KY384_002519 [Bacidia gigantensis]|uniref:uncharacterized protein n=1 Tax=Bacidia gigantensis TaxID=2732470 RepID=UPI001D0491F2|nr:uncharacterized protein KY384_002519 [Bacidia gigantensis]KAG8532642.1 hypothetical protein KY384_002519 [Bacidia gigantensis]